LKAAQTNREAVLPVHRLGDAAAAVAVHRGPSDDLKHNGVFGVVGQPGALKREQGGGKRERERERERESSSAPAARHDDA
jgi:hypothetical protein